MTVRTTAAVRLRRPERRAAILAGAAAAFARGGFAGTSMADIAAATGVSHLIVYRHFDSKERLYEVILDQAVAHLGEALSSRGAVGDYGPTPAVLLHAARRDPAAFEVLWRHAAHEPAFAHVADRGRHLVQAATERALTPHVARAHRRWAARATVAYLVESVLVWVEDGAPRLDDRFVAATNSALRAGVRSWARASSP